MNESDLINSLLEKMIIHLERLTAVKNLTCKIQITILKNNLNSVSYLIDNRDRLINLLNAEQAAIENILNNNNITSIRDIIISWSKDTTHLLDQTTSINYSISELLLREKEDLKEKIATIHNAKNSLKGYNLTSVR